MADGKVKNYNTILARGDGTTPTEAFTAIARVRDLPAPAIANNDDDVSIYGQRFDEFLITTGQVEEFTIEILSHMDNAGHELLMDDAISPPATPTNYKLTFPDTGFWVFAAWVKKVQPKTSPRAGTYAWDVTFRPTAAPTVTDPS